MSPIAPTVTGKPRIMLFAVGAGITVLPLFAAQALLPLIGPDLNFGRSSSLIAAAEVAGYAAGLFLLVPLVDVVANRRLILMMVASASLFLFAIAVSPSANFVLCASFLSGMSATSIQMLVPLVSSLCVPGQRGRVIGDVMVGLMLGILFSRPLASLMGGTVGWRAFYGVLAALTAALFLAFLVKLPERSPISRSSYFDVLMSLRRVVLDYPIIGRRGTCQGLLMISFSLFWTSVPFLLGEPPFSLKASGIALFCFAGAGGAISAPIAGRLADHGHSRRTTATMHFLAACAVVGTAFIPEHAAGHRVLVLAGLAIGAFLLDFAVIGDQTLGRREINLLSQAVRGRSNAVYTGIFFLGATLGTALSGPILIHCGWLVTMGVAAASILIAALAHLSFRIDSHRRRACAAA
ncbi:MAG: MFS transporter [Verrucomicrobiota bacterium]|nr:MFS transporter [Verrucomicrobiota bacterium]